MKKNTLKTIRNVMIAIIVMLALFIGAGVAYVRFGGTPEAKQAGQTSKQDIEVYKPITPRKPSPNVPESASVASLVSPVKAGSNTSMTVRTLAGSTCKINVSYNKVKSRDSGLSDKVADDYGQVTWSWTVDSSAPAGTWPAQVICSLNKKSAMVIGDLKVTN